MCYICTMYLHFFDAIPVDFFDVVCAGNDDASHQVADTMEDVAQLLVRQCWRTDVLDVLQVLR